MTADQAAAITVAVARAIERRLAQGKAAKPPFCAVKCGAQLDRVPGCATVGAYRLAEARELRLI